MARIILRCFVVLTFTGVLLSTAQESTVSEISYSTTKSHETPTSTPENSFNTANTSSSFYLSPESNKNVSLTEVAESSSHSEVTATGVSQPPSKVPIDSKAEDFSTVSSLSENTTDDALDDSNEPYSLHVPSFSPVYITRSNDDSTPNYSSERRSEMRSSKGEGGEKEQIPTTEEEKIAGATVNRPNNAAFLENVSIDSGQSTVPSKEELVSSDVDNKSPEDITSIATNKVQNDDGSENKSATHKRSLNATNSIVSSTTVINSSSEMSDAASLSHVPINSELKEPVDEDNYYYDPEPENISPHSVNTDKKEESFRTIDDILESETTPGYSINSDNPHADMNAGHIAKSGSVVPEPSSSVYVQDASLSPVSLDALTILNEESIHPLNIFDSAAQVVDTKRVSTMSSIPLKSPELEIEHEELVSNLNSPASLVTFDPDGMTRKFFHEPDSITFSPKVVYEKPTGSQFSDLEHEEPQSKKPELSTDDLSTAFVTADVGSSSHKIEGFHSSEREVEVQSGNREMIPHDEPDRETPTSMTAFEDTERPEGKSSASDLKTTEKSGTGLPINDESEEMLNDSPHFVQNENNPTAIPTGSFSNKFLNKNLENNISNDITHSAIFKNTHIRESHHELDFPIEYQTQQSEIRPVTAISPIETSGTVTELPISHDSQSQLPFNNVPKSDHPVSTPSDIPTSVISPNPSPSTVNKSLEKITVTVSPEMLPKDYVPPELLPKDYVPPEMLPKDFVTPKNTFIDNTPQEMPKKEFIPSEMLPKDYVPPEMLPKDDVPPEMLPKDYIPSEMPSKEPVKSGVLPKDNIPPELLPKDYIPPEILPKDYVPPEMLPKDYISDQPEQENNTDTIVNSTIAGVAVKTSVSVSLPLSKSTNGTMGTSEISAKELSNTSLQNSDLTQTSNPPNKNSGGQFSSAVTTQAPSPSTTESGGFRIRKPRPKGSGDSTVAARTRKPFLPSQIKPSTTVGPPVSIFKQTRTRLGYITSSTTPRPFSQFSTIRVHYASRYPGLVPGGEMEFSVVPITTTVPTTTTEAEEPFSEEAFTGQTIGPMVPTDDNVTLLKVAGMIVVDKGLRWNEVLNNRLSPQYKEREKFVQSQLYRLFRTSPIAPQLWKIQIDGFSGKRNSKSVVIDFFLYLIKTRNEIKPEQLVAVFHDKLINNSFSRFTVDTNKTAFEFLNEELMRTTTPLPEEERLDPVIPQWAIAVIVVGAASLIFIVLFAAVAILGRHHVRRRYSNKLNDEDFDRPSDWESKMAAAYENLAADTIYDAEDFHSDTYKKSYLVD